jgi:predicted dehydrogenase
MRFFIAGLGSMGKRRIRNLQALGHNDITGYDIRDDRNKEAEVTYHIKTIHDYDSIRYNDFDAMIVSVPPDVHNTYLKQAVLHKKPVFVEASVILSGLQEISTLAKKNNILIAPSCTLRFHPAIKIIKEMVRNKDYGKITNFVYHSGQYLPDWHPWERVTEYYVSKKETGGGREIVPFELTWIADIFGLPKRITGFYGRTMDVGAKIDDTYAISLDFNGKYGLLLVDVVSRYATRRLTINMEKAQIVWKWDEPCVWVYDADRKKWNEKQYPRGKSVEGYNSNIIEDMYIEEIQAFINAIKGTGVFSNSLDDDIAVLKQLYKMEKEVVR